jgi:hypothetical protein
MERDIRIYKYSRGTLKKVGSGKAGLDPHFYSNEKFAVGRISYLKITNPETQYLLVEYTGKYESKIIKIF